ncbi:universal stress protein [Hydrogenophaga sp.]|uniref:universal stress protein n=1 Tax=Hydrogenophaga sp. TaxID=1904254 RepID=UPI002CE0D107|nr:universal stress protein [Hydrogenophaga sp.]HMP09072.1 universal stress protein [Hydrogenophaga sp.]
MLKLLIPVDGSPSALLAVHHALELVGHGLRARFVVANVQEPANLYEVVVAHDPVVLQQVSEAAARDLMQPAIELLQAAGQQVEVAPASGDVVPALVEVIETHGCHGVIMGSHGAGGFKAAVLGSVSGEMARSSPVPVTLVKPVEVEEA